MAKKAAKKEYQLPKGFKAARIEAIGFFDRRASNSITGLMLGFFIVKGKFGDKKVYRIRLTEGVTEYLSEGEVGEASAGDVVLLDRTGWLAPLDDVGEGQEVHVFCVGKDGEGKMDPWKYEIGIRE